MSTNFRDAVLAMTEEMPNARASTIVRLALALEGVLPALDDPAALARWAARQPDVTRNLAEDKPINAIKELRALTKCSLLQAKNAVDVMRGVS